MTTISRFFKKTLQTRLEEEAPLIQVLVGPRQVGKTTAIRQIFADKGLYFSADSPVPVPTSEIEVLWEKAFKSTTPLLAIDEVEKWILSSWGLGAKNLRSKSNPVRPQKVISKDCSHFAVVILSMSRVSCALTRFI